jgi:hypothetical protein
MILAPVFSHGGPGSQGFPPVPGTGLSNGQPVSIAAAIQDAVFSLILSGITNQTLNVQIQANGGLVDATGNPPSTDWMDVSGGGYTMTVGAGNAPAVLCKIIPRAKPYYRTVIVGYTSGTLVSYVDGVIGSFGLIQAAQRPALPTQFQPTTV